MEKKNRKYFPIFVDLSEKKVMIVGAGTIAKRRIRALADFTGHLVVIAPEVNPELRDLEAAGRIQILRKKFEKEDVSDADMVIAATNDRRLNQTIYAVCKEAGIPVNVCNDKTRCDFYFPVLAYEETIVAGVRSAGQDSARARRVAGQIRELLGEARPADFPVEKPKTL
ncbi:MAG: bifunctional precorrin-2 dehydrogenase/sirohydrochlorin ferrochelatase [Clostridiales bacterium]|nr:bifunctional precorrin-2 dehydrogenase/sirohydrochlorin ferrochelatase [Clostridiales bacterium]